MKKRIALVLLALLTLIVATCAIIACGDVHKHDLEEIAQVAATCSAKGNINYWHCKSCDKYYSDVSANNEISKYDTVIDIDSNNHNLIILDSLSPTCTDTGWQNVVCSDCNYTARQELSKSEHLYNCVPADNIRHYNKCINCSYTQAPENHTAKSGVCSKCNYLVKADSVGLELKKFNYSPYYYYVAGIGTCTDTDIVIPSEVDGIPVTSINRFAFVNCTSLTSIIIPNSVTEIGAGAFKGCTSLTSIIIPNSITKIGVYMIKYCTSLTSITIPNSVTEIDEFTFNGCTSLTNITIPNSITNISHTAFDGCENLHYNEYDNALYLGNDSNPYVALIKAKSNDITLCDINNNTKIICDGAFANCESLTSITMPNSVTSIGYNAFRGCTSLTNIAIPRSITNISRTAFDGCVNLHYNEYDNALYLGNDSNPYVALIKAKSNDITLCDINNNTKIICDGAFANCESLTSITMPNSVTSIGYNAFRGCTSLTNIIIPDSVTSIGYGAFRDCTSLTSITIPDSVTEINSWAFDGCTSLTSITIPDSVTKIGSYAFRDCSNLTIYCKADSKPSAWDSAWDNKSLTGKLPIVWGYSE